MPQNLPYITTPGAIRQALDKIKVAATPERVTQDFLSTKLGIKKGVAQTLIPFLKKISFVGSDGSPTETYKRFRNPTQSGIAVAEAIKIGYKPLYELNEYAHDLSDNDIRGLVMQVTGLEKKSRVLSFIVNCFNAIKEYADFDKSIDLTQIDVTNHDSKGEIQLPTIATGKEVELGVNLSYTINLNLPATSDISVFNAIFKSLRENLLKK